MESLDVRFRRSAAIVLTTAAMAIACTDSTSDGALSRDVAKKRIFEHTSYPHVSRIRVPATYPYPRGNEELERIDRLAMRLKQQGLMTWGDKHYGQRLIGFTDASKKWLDHDGQATKIDDGSSWYSVQLCKIEFGGVTGIRLDPSKTQADVEYTLVVSEMTPLVGFDLPGEPCASAASTTSNAAPDARVTVSATAKFSRYDDGWRLAR